MGDADISLCMAHHMHMLQAVKMKFGPVDRPEAQVRFDPRFETFGALVVE